MNGDSLSSPSPPFFCSFLQFQKKHGLTEGTLLGSSWDFTVPLNFEIVFPQLDLFGISTCAMIFQKKVGAIGLMLSFVSL
jgi:hypothetical protein